MGATTVACSPTIDNIGATTALRFLFSDSSVCSQKHGFFGKEELIFTIMSRENELKLCSCSELLQLHILGQATGLAKVLGEDSLFVFQRSRCSKLFLSVERCGYSGRQSASSTL